MARIQASSRAATQLYSPHLSHAFPPRLVPNFNSTADGYPRLTLKRAVALCPTLRQMVLPGRGRTCHTSGNGLHGTISQQDSGVDINRQTDANRQTRETGSPRKQTGTNEEVIIRKLIRSSPSLVEAYIDGKIRSRRQRAFYVLVVVVIRRLLQFVEITFEPTILRRTASQDIVTSPYGLNTAGCESGNSPLDATLPPTHEVPSTRVHVERLPRDVRLRPLQVRTERGSYFTYSDGVHWDVYRSISDGCYTAGGYYNEK